MKIWEVAWRYVLVSAVFPLLPGFYSVNSEWFGMPTLRQQLAGAAATPSGRPIRIRGTIITVEGDRLGVATPSGEVWIKLIEPLRINGVVAAKLADIAPGAFVGTAGRKQADGSFRSLEIHIFPEGRRLGEGQSPHDLPGTTMTNANVEKVENLIQVEKVVQKLEGQLLTLKHKGGEIKVVVTADTPIVRLVPGERGLLKPGAAVYIIATQAADGSISVQSISVGVDGVTPPM